MYELNRSSDFTVSVEKDESLFSSDSSPSLSSLSVSLSPSLFLFLSFTVVVTLSPPLLLLLFLRLFSLLHSLPLLLPDMPVPFPPFPFPLSLCLPLPLPLLLARITCSPMCPIESSTRLSMLFPASIPVLVVVPDPPSVLFSRSGSDVASLVFPVSFPFLRSTLSSRLAHQLLYLLLRASVEKTNEGEEPVDNEEEEETEGKCVEDNDDDDDEEEGEAE